MERGDAKRDFRFLSSSLFSHLSFSCLPKRRKTRRCRGSIVLSAAREEVPHMARQISLLPHPRSILFSSLRFRLSLPARCSVHRQHIYTQDPGRTAKSASPHQGGNSVGGKVIRPLATKSFLADSCFIILHPASTLAGSGLFVSLSLSLALLRDGRAPLPFRALLLARWIDALLLSRLGKIAMDIITRGAYGGCCCKLGFYDGNSHTRSGQRL